MRSSSRRASATHPAQVVITPSEQPVLAEAGYTPRLYPTINRVPGPYLAPNFADIIRGVCAAIALARWRPLFAVPRAV